MNFIKIVLPFALFIFIGCAEEAKETEKASTTTTTTTLATDQQPLGTQPPPPAPRPTEPPQNSAGVWHYTCAKGCAGGGGAAQPCAVCGDMLVHNKGYHDNANPTSTITSNTSNSSGTKISPVITGPGASQIQQGQPAVAPRAPEPAQNAAGVWHFTCSKGCAGGSGDRSAKCAGCGGALAHNKAYHN